MDFSQIEELSQDARVMLCYYALIGCGSNKSMMENARMLRSNGFPGFDGVVAEKELNGKGLLMSGSYNWYTNSYNYEINSAVFVKVLYYLHSVHPEWVKSFTSSRQITAIKYNAIRQVVKALVANGGKSCPVAHLLTWSDIDYLRPVFWEDDFAPVILELRHDVFCGVVSSELTFSCEFMREIDKDKIRNYIDSNENLSSAEFDMLHAEVDMYQYFVKGQYAETMEAPLKSKNPSALKLTGIRLVNLGRYAEAIAYFQAAMKILNRDTSMKNMFLHPICNYYLMLAYLHEGSAESMTKLKQFLNKSNIEEYISLFPSRIVAIYARDNSVDEYEDVMWNVFDQCTKYMYPPLYAYMVFSLARFFQLTCANKMNFANPVPMLKILAHEMSSQLDLSDEQRAELRNLYGDKPALTSLHFKARWETVLEELAGFSNTENASKRTSRIMYLLSSPRHDYLEVREQTRLKNGEWGSGKSVSITRFRMGNVDCMDEADRRIMARTLGSYSYDVLLEDVVEEMTGESRLYVGTRAPYKLVNVVEEKPYFIIERQENGFVVRSNVLLANISQRIPIKWINDHELSFVKIPEDHRTQYEKILSVSSFPLDAEEKLRQFLPRIGASFDIHSDLLSSGYSLPTFDGSTIACIRIERSNSGDYSINVTACPFADGKRRFSLGKGDAKYVDEGPSGRIWVIRDLKGERKTAKALKQFIESMEAESIEVPDPAIALDGTLSPYVSPLFLLELVDFIKQNPDIAIAEWPEKQSVKIRNVTANSDGWNLSLRERGSWFEVEGEVRIDEDTVLSMSQLLDLINTSKGRYIQLNDGDFIKLSDTLTRQLQQLDSIASRNRGKLQISPFCAAVLGDDMVGENNSMQLSSPKRLRELRQAILDSSNYSPEVPKELNATLRPYQLVGYQWMARLNSWGAGALLADDMGLGKTVQTIAFLLLKAKDGPSLVVAPASVAPNWCSELERFAPSLNVRLINYESDRKSVVEQSKAGDVVVSTYGVLLSEQDVMVEKEWNVVCLDEAHVIKNRGAKTSAVAMKLKAANRVMLTGTPLQNHLGELWSLFQFLNPGLLGGFDDFTRRYIVPIERDKDKFKQGQLDNLVRPFLLRRTKQTVLDELPEKTEIYQKIDLSQDELAAYESIRQNAEKMLKELEKSKSKRDQDMPLDLNVLAEITRLRQAACTPELVEPKWKGKCTKAEALVELLQEVVEGENRALVFSQFTSFLDIIRKYLDEAKIPYLYIDGSVPVRTRTKLVKEFQEGKCPVFIISLKAGGLGLNLTGANYVFHLDPWWNPAIEQQATDRAYRIGQKQVVTVYHLVARSTIEEKIIRLHETKRALAENILEGTDISHHITGEELMEMVRG